MCKASEEATRARDSISLRRSNIPGRRCLIEPNPTSFRSSDTKEGTHLLVSSRRARRFLHALSASSLSVHETEGVEDIIRSNCLPTSASYRDDENKRAKGVWCPTVSVLRGASLRRRQHLVTTCLHSDIFLRQGSNWAHTCTRGTKRKTHKVPGRCDAADGCSALRRTPAALVLREIYVRIHGPWDSVNDRTWGKCARHCIQIKAKRKNTPTVVGAAVPNI